MRDRVAEIRDAATFAGTPVYAAVVAVAMHHYYTAFESAIERSLRFFDGDLPQGGDWHRALLLEAVRPLPGIRMPLVSASTLPDWDELLRFRHFFRHAYAVSLDWKQLAPLMERVDRLHPMACADLEKIQARIAETLATVEETGD